MAAQLHFSQRTTTTRGQAEKRGYQEGHICSFRMSIVFDIFQYSLGTKIPRHNDAVASITRGKFASSVHLWFVRVCPRLDVAN